MRRLTSRPRLNAYRARVKKALRTYRTNKVRKYLSLKKRTRNLDPDIQRIIRAKFRWNQLRRHVAVTKALRSYHKQGGLLIQPWHKYRKLNPYGDRWYPKYGRK